jgi:hypothetical protein
MINTAVLLPKAGNYQFAPSGGVSDRMLMEVATQFENQVIRKIAAFTPEQLGKRFSGDAEVLAMTKYDGEGVFVYFEDGQWTFAFNAPSGRLRVGLPVLERLQAHLATKGVRRALFRCELYLPTVPGQSKRSTVSDVIRVTFGSNAGEIARLKLAMLDIIMLDGRDLRQNQENFRVTWELLGELFGEDESAPFHRPAGVIVPESKLRAMFDEAIAAGAEGLIIRRLQRSEISKVKPHLSVDAVVIGYVEADFEGKTGVASLLTALSYPGKVDGALVLQTFARVGSGFTDTQREELLALFSPLQVAAPITMTDSDGRPVNFVKPIHIAELHGEDLVTNSSRDRENRTQLFTTSDGESYVFRGLAPLPRMTFATFNQLRGDKNLATGGARVEQVAGASPAIPALASAEATVERKILRREVFTKGEALRKLLVIEQPNGARLPYLVYWTDYSAKRKDPLKIDLAGAFTPSRAEALANRLVAENVTKGFERFGAATAAPVQAEESVEAAPPKKPRAPKKAKSG